MAEDRLSLSCLQCLLWARNRPWPTEFERLLSPKETLKHAV
jgi:hypothetical protein